MSRHNPFHPNSAVTMQAVTTWVDRCLRTDGSLFGDDHLWSVALLSEVHDSFNGRPDTGKDTFNVKLERQFREASPMACKLLAEMLWILNLFPTNMGPETKRRAVAAAWSWSGETLGGAQAAQLLADDVLRGLGSAGPGFMNHKPRELRFLINSMKAFKVLADREKASLLADPWAFAGWLDKVPDGGYRQLRHILPHLVFPEAFERIASPGHIRRILGSFRKLDKKALRGMSKIDQDRELLRLRQDLERENKSLIDFYQPDIKDIWAPEPETEDVVLGEEVAEVGSVAEPKTAVPLNQILYGPPGTGKTYRAVDRALMILDPTFAARWATDRDALKERYDELVEEGLIRFVTFHQSFSYEEFVEGLRAETTANGSIHYHVEDGIFKAFCDESSRGSRLPVGESFSSYVVTRCTDEILWLDKPNGSKLPLPWQILDELVKMVGQGLITIQDIRDKVVFDRVPTSRLEKYLVNGYNNVIPRIVERIMERDTSRATTVSQKRVLIIDEINRGNISKILGEMITLIEPSKRLGAKEALTTILPYSKTRFGVPIGLHIIGTMNTADRSLTSLDMALRRRFVFEEIEPQPERLEDIEIAGVNIRAMLTIMNARIEALLDREHRLGHAYFLHLEAADDVAQLKHLFTRRIMPLLKEYFFDDWQRIRLVLNDHRKIDPADRFVTESPESMAALFGTGDVQVPTNRPWTINLEALDRPSAYQRIIG